MKQVRDRLLTAYRSCTPTVSFGGPQKSLIDTFEDGIDLVTVGAYFFQGYLEFSDLCHRGQRVIAALLGFGAKKSGAIATGPEETMLAFDGLSNV